MQLLIVDDDFGSRGGMCHSLETVYPAASVHQARSISEAITRLTEHTSMDLVLLDLNLDDSRGLDSLRTMKQWCEANDCNPRIVVVSAAADYDDSIIANAIENCATGFIAKGMSEEVFLLAIKLTLAGQLYIPERYLRPHRTPASDKVCVTSRERQVLALLIKGLTYKQIAKALTQPGHPMSDNTVRVHVQRMAWKLNPSASSQGSGLTAKAAVMTAFAQGQLAFSSTA